MPTTGCASGLPIIEPYDGAPPRARTSPAERREPVAVARSACSRDPDGRSTPVEPGLRRARGTRAADTRRPDRSGREPVAVRLADRRRRGALGHGRGRGAGTGAVVVVVVLVLGSSGSVVVVVVDLGSTTWSRSGIEHGRADVRIEHRGRRRVEHGGAVGSNTVVDVGSNTVVDVDVRCRREVDDVELDAGRIEHRRRRRRGRRGGDRRRGGHSRSGVGRRVGIDGERIGEAVGRPHLGRQVRRTFPAWSTGHAVAHFQAPGSRARRPSRRGVVAVELVARGVATSPSRADQDRAARRRREHDRVGESVKPSPTPERSSTSRTCSTIAADAVCTSTAVADIVTERQIGASDVAHSGLRECHARRGPVAGCRPGRRAYTALDRPRALLRPARQRRPERRRSRRARCRCRDGRRSSVARAWCAPLGPRSTTWLAAIADTVGDAAQVVDDVRVTRRSCWPRATCRRSRGAIDERHELRRVGVARPALGDAGREARVREIGRRQRARVGGDVDEHGRRGPAARLGMPRDRDGGAVGAVGRARPRCVGPARGTRSPVGCHPDR